MAWGKIHDTFYDHRKVRRMPRRVRNEACGVYWRAISFANRHRSDGVIYGYDLEAIDATKAAVQALVDVGLWELVTVDEDGEATLDHYVIHDYLEDNMSAEEIAERAEKKAAAGRAGGKASGEARRNKKRSKPEAGASTAVRPPLNQDSESESERDSEAPTPTGVLLSAEQLAAWKDFTDPSWQPFKAAWLGKGLLLPPSGRADEPGSQRALLWEVAEAYPDELGRWVRESRARDSRVVIDDVLEQYHEARRKAARRADAQEAESARHKGPAARAEASRGLEHISRVVAAGGAG